VPSFDVLEPLAPDACRSDPSAPCCLYWHTKLHALNGGRDKLSRESLDLVGVDVWPINTPGWRSTTGLYLDDPLEGLLSTEQIALLRSVMDIEFLGYRLGRWPMGTEPGGRGSGIDCRGRSELKRRSGGVRRKANGLQSCEGAMVF
jgi:hypothetical protein